MTLQDMDFYPSEFKETMAFRKIHKSQIFRLLDIAFVGCISPDKLLRKNTLFGPGKLLETMGFLRTTSKPKKV